MATFTSSSPYHLVIHLYFLTAILSTIESKIDSTEIFGPLTTTPQPENQSSSPSNPKTPLNSSIDPLSSPSSYESKPFSLRNIFSSFKSHKNFSSSLLPTYLSSNRHHPSRQETPISDFAVSHPLISDANARIPLYLYNPGLARKIGLSTLLMTSVIYGLTILPAIYAVTGNLPLPSGFMSSLTGGKRRKRSFYLGTPWELPLFDKPTTEKFLALLEATLEVRKVNSVTCKRQHLCKVYQWALKSEDKPLTLSTFERALVNIFGVAAERRGLHVKLVPAVKLYSEAALVALTGSNCTLIYPCTETINYSKASRLF